jgi:hypothetical protein
MMENIMEQEKSYDSLPNFTAADCRLILSFILTFKILANHMIDFKLLVQLAFLTTCQ